MRWRRCDRARRRCDGTGRCVLRGRPSFVDAGTAADRLRSGRLAPQLLAWRGGLGWWLLLGKIVGIAGVEALEALRRLAAALRRWLVAVVVRHGATSTRFRPRSF